MPHRIIEATTNHDNPLGYTYFIVFNCSRQPVCFQLHKGLVLGKSTKERQLSKNNQFPILIALPIATGYSRIGCHKRLPGLLIVATRPSEKKRLYSPRHGMQAKRIYASILEMPYLRTGIDARLYDTNGNALTAATFKKNNGSSDPYQLFPEIGFFGKGEGSSPSEKFYLVPVNHLYIDHELQKKCSKWIPLTELSDERTAIPGEYNREYIEKTSPLEKNPWLNSWNNRRYIKDATRKATPYKPGKIYKAGARWDYLGWTRRYATLCKPSDIASLNLQRMRALSTPSKGPCIVATAKNEAAYISHWCAYHLSIGFEHI